MDRCLFKVVLFVLAAASVVVLRDREKAAGVIAEWSTKKQYKWVKPCVWGCGCRKEGGRGTYLSFGQSTRTHHAIWGIPYQDPTTFQCQKFFERWNCKNMPRLDYLRLRRHRHLVVLVHSSTHRTTTELYESRNRWPCSRKWLHEYIQYGSQGLNCIEAVIKFWANRCWNRFSNSLAFNGIQSNLKGCRQAKKTLNHPNAKNDADKQVLP